jgi:hypothetical protein
MKPEQYNKLTELIGKDKADEVRENLIKHKEEKKRQKQKDAAELEEMVDRMIAKKDLIGGVYYNGHRWRGKHVAMWDAEKEAFLTINYTMGNFFLEELQHYEDVAETRIDGFIPFIEIEKFTL